jgi:D-alanyl-lipoteichoic acid acyltransferase DltB (MBOAT superfamily)
MLFQSQVFLLIFLPVTLAIWFALAAWVRGREWALIGLSLIFYGWWDPRFVPLLLGQTCVSWLLAEAFIRSGKRHRGLLWLAIAANLAVLAFFKYAAFLAGSLVAITGLDLPALKILLPIGISFFTFEIVSYLVDLGWHDAPRYRLRRFMLFVMLFPRLIAGPIVRHHEIIPQFDLDPRREGLAERLGKGATLLVIGLAAKVLLADRLARVADKAFESAQLVVPDLGTAWSGALAFTFQLFLDFSAYSLMAIGIALMLGILLPENFDTPYRSTSLRDFWQRWHMTLSRYLRDYVYFSLGGSREGAVRFVMATIVTMGLCGLWHGAGWTFVVWGLFHGAGLIVNRAWRSAGMALPTAAAWALTMTFVVAGWVLFRAPDFSTAWSMLGGMTGAGGFTGRLEQPALIAVAAAVSLSGIMSSRTVLAALKPHPALAVAAALAAVVVVLDVGRGQPQTFIYFQF